MENLELHKELKAFVEAIDSFPASEPKSMFYDTEALLSIKEFDLLKDFFGESEHKKALRLINKAQEAVQACKSGAPLEDTFLAFQEVKSKIPDLSENAQSYAQLYYLSGMAYYYYRKENFLVALNFTFDEIKKTELLEMKGATTLHYRRIGHIYNVIKLLYELGEVEEATKYSLGDLLYTINGDTSLLPDGIWNHESLDFIKYLRQRHFDKSFLSSVEFAIEKYNDTTYGRSFFYNNLFSKIPEFDVTNNNLAMLHNWLYLQKLYDKNMYKEFILNTIEFCQESFDYTFDILKLYLLSQIISLLKTTNNINEKNKQKINDYILLTLQSKRTLKENVCSIMFE